MQAIVALRAELEGQGHDAGAETIAYHLAQERQDIPSLSTIWRVLRREGLVIPQRQKRPRCEYEIDPEVAPWVVKIFRWFVEERLSLAEIIRRQKALVAR